MSSIWGLILQVLSGACGIVYGANVIWQMYDKARLQREYTSVVADRIEVYS
jgi:hypothetical protein